MTSGLREKLIIYLAKIYFSEPSYWVAKVFLEERAATLGYRREDVFNQLERLFYEGIIDRRKTRDYPEYQYIPDIREIEHVIDKF